MIYAKLRNMKKISNEENMKKEKIRKQRKSLIDHLRYMQNN